MNNDTKVFILGERRIITLKVWKQNATEFAVNNCMFELFHLDELEAHGSCEVEPDNGSFLLSCQIEPQKLGSYRLCFSFSVGTEIIKRNVTIEVKQ